MSRPVRIASVTAGVARIEWDPDTAVAAVAAVVAEALVEHGRVEAWVDPDERAELRTAAWSGLRREGVARGVAAGADRVVYARLARDPAPDQPEGFRSLLNSFLPRKRAITQLLIRDTGGRVLVCELTYKADWDLPGGVVEVGESPRDAASREVSEELSLEVPAGELLLTDWLPAWSGWDDALCLVWDGGVHDASFIDPAVLEAKEIAAVHWCSPDEIREHCADFTARRIEAALARVAGSGQPYTESGRS
ncbi:MAG: NUDIX domain-containing protein [Nocardioides sp.]